MDALPRYRRNPAIVLEQVGDELFLVEPASQSIFHLNTIGSGIWQLLSEPIAEAEIVEVLRAAFPDVSPDAVAADVAGILRDLAQRRLVTPVD